MCCSFPASECRHVRDSYKHELQEQTSTCKRPHTLDFNLTNDCGTPTCTRPHTLDFNLTNDCGEKLEHDISKTAETIKNLPVEKNTCPPCVDVSRRLSERLTSCELDELGCDSLSGSSKPSDSVFQSPPTPVRSQRLTSVYCSMSDAGERRPAKTSLAPEVALFLRLLLGWLFELPVFPDGLFYTPPEQTDINAQVISYMKVASLSICRSRHYRYAGHVAINMQVTPLSINMKVTLI